MSLGRVLVLRNSVAGPAGFSNKGIDKALEVIKGVAPNVTVVERDLLDKPVPVLNKETFKSIRMGQLETDEHKASIALSDELIAEIKSVDLLIAGLPRYNFHAPASFKNYMDYIARPRVTFQYSAKGPEGLLPNIPVWAMMSTGGIYGEDYYHQWVKTVMPFVGLNDVNFFNIEGTGMGKGDEAIANLDFSKVLEKFNKKQ